jgi:microsomal dipeptidase-like Zn-dependent dipeptidase
MSVERSFHDGLVVIDGLQYSAWDRATLEELRAGGLSAVHVTLAYWEDARATLRLIGDWHRRFESHADLIVHARTADDILAARASGRTAILFGFQNCSPIEDDLGLVQIFHELGVRVMQLTYNNQSLLGGGCYEPHDSGVTRFGREVIAEMNRVGMVIDLSHSGERTTLETIALSTRPVTISHADPLFLHDNIRNKSDRVLKALGESGGMLGFSLYPLHIGPGCTRRRFCEAVARTAELIGVERLGIGTDSVRNQPDPVLDWMRNGRWTRGPAAPKPRWPEWADWFRSPADFPNLTEGLLEAGFARDEVAAIMGGNWLRFFREGFGPA